MKEIFEYKEHFISRCKERYGVDFDPLDYEYLSKTSKLYYSGLISKSYYASVGFIKYKGDIIWVIYNSKRKLFTTTLPKEIEKDIIQTIRSVFPFRTRQLAYEIYRLIEKELSYERVDFATEKDAALYYLSNSKHPHLMIAKYKGKLNVFKYCRTIQSIIECRHEKVRLTIESK